MLKRILLVTGTPGIGKTTALVKTVEALAKRGFKVGGMISQEVRVNGMRIGFEILDLRGSRRGCLAQVNLGSGPRVGRYWVNLKDLESIGAQSILDAVEDCDVVAIDEIGPMELFSMKFREAVSVALRSEKLVLAVVHWKATDRFAIDVKAREDSELFALTYENRDERVGVVASRALEYLEGR